MKKNKKWIALLLAAVMLLGMLAGCKEAEPAAESTDPVQSTDPTESTDPSQTTDSTAQPGYGNNDVTALSDYAVLTATPDDAVMSAVIAVDGEGNPVLTNSLFQACYWIEFYGFLSSYGELAYYLGLDYTQPLAGQTSFAENRTWEQYFLEAAAEHFCENYALAQAAYAEGYVLSEEDAATIDDITAPDGNFAAEAAEAGFDTAEEYIKANFGDGVSAADYQAYLRMFYAALDYVTQIEQSVNNELTDAEVEAYYDENAATYESYRIFKQNNVSVRHILIAPEGDQDATLNDWTEEQWSAAEQKANEVYALWQEEPTEENFAALVAEYSTDTASVEAGGLYEDFATDAMVEAFSDWCFDAARVAGDTGIVRSLYGYHIIYFVEQTETRGWFDTAKSDMADERITARIQALRDTYPVLFDYTQVRIFDMVTKAMESAMPQG